MMGIFDYVKFLLILFVFCINFKTSKQDLSPESPNVEWSTFRRVANLLGRSKRQVTVGSPTPELPPGDFPQPAACGINGKSTNLVKNTDSSAGIDWPWIVGIVAKNQNPPEAFCGGALLSRNYVLTAAHCFQKYTAGEIFVRMGEYDFETAGETKFVDYQVEKIINHPLYDHTLHKNDVSLVKLKELVQYTDYIRPICLPSADYQIKINQTAIVAGWGLTAFGEVNSLKLLQVTIPVWNLTHCQENYASKVFDENICAAGYEGDKDSCVGDSGGPLISQLPSGRWIQIGIVSWGVYCGDAEKPGVYVSVSYFLDWIRKNMPDAVLV